MKNKRSKAIAIGELAVAGFFVVDDVIPFLGVWDDAIALGLTADALYRLGRKPNCEGLQKHVIKLIQEIKELKGEKPKNYEKKEEELKKKLEKALQRYNTCEIRKL